MPEIRVFDPDTIRRDAQRIAGGADPSEDDFAVFDTGAEGARARHLWALANDARKGNRDLLIPTAATVTRLLSVESNCPNFSDVAGIYIRAARLASLAQAPLSVPPILLTGAPGVGKSFFARSIAEALQTDVHGIAGPGFDDGGVLSGHSSSWKAARAGAIARSLINGATAQPLFFLDEIDKVPASRESDPLDVLHAALEPENAKRFIDSYLEAPFAAHRVLWIATANSVAALKSTIADRFLVMPVSAPERDASIAITRRIYGAVIEPYDSALTQELSDEVAAAMADVTPRRQRLIFEIAAGFAATRKRRGLSPSDVENARRLLAPPERRAFGFV